MARYLPRERERERERDASTTTESIAPFFFRGGRPARTRPAKVGALNGGGRCLARPSKRSYYLPTFGRRLNRALVRCRWRDEAVPIKSRTGTRQRARALRRMRTAAGPPVCYLHLKLYILGRRYRKRFFDGTRKSGQLHSHYYYKHYLALIIKNNLVHNNN